ncbi:hypothetical protein AB3M83_03615 [Microbacterium sp. 179-B 1A2 NHS]|uniref:hypothetical protein n=1 Tax=Microbacterium sp. 179-B 1A2 NHS TaxID=3142383 RepID=UPI0039A2AC32
MKKHRLPPISDDEQIARYAYILGNVPSGVADRAYAAAFARLPAPERHRLLAELGAQLPVEQQDPDADDPERFAARMRNLHARSALVTCRSAPVLSAAFVSSPPVAAYFTSGVGSVSIDQQPPWVHELVGHETAPIDGGRMHHRKGAITGRWFR